MILHRVIFETQCNSSIAVSPETLRPPPRAVWTWITGSMTVSVTCALMVCFMNPAPCNFVMFSRLTCKIKSHMLCAHCISGDDSVTIKSKRSLKGDKNPLSGDTWQISVSVLTLQFNDDHYHHDLLLTRVRTGLHSDAQTLFIVTVSTRLNP